MPRYSIVHSAEGGDHDLVTNIPYASSLTGSEGVASPTSVATPTTTTSPATPMTAATTFSHTASHGDGAEVPGAQAQDNALSTCSVHLPNGEVIPLRDLVTMRIKLHEARTAGDFPRTTIPPRVLEAIVQDYDMLTRLRELRGDINSPTSAAYDRYYVECTRVIQQRDYAFKVKGKKVGVKQHITQLVENQNIGADLHGIVQHAAASGVHRVLTSSHGNGSAIHEMVQQALQSLVDEGFNARKLVDMDAVLEDIIAVVEATALDATGPLRLNVNRMGNVLNATETNMTGIQNEVGNLSRTGTNIHNEVGNLSRTGTNIHNEVSNLSTQLGAMNNHVSAVGSHVSALGALMQVINTIATSSNTQIGQLGTQVEAVQTLVNMIPNLIQEAILEALPQALQSTLIPILLAAAQSGGANITKKHMKTKKRGFFSRLFKRGGKKDGSGMRY